jgi:hypothetical protein
MRQDARHTPGNPLDLSVGCSVYPVRRAAVPVSQIRSRSTRKPGGALAPLTQEP